MSSSSGLAASNMPPEEQTEARMSNLHADANLNEKALLSSIEDTSFPDMTVQPGDMNTAIKNLTRGILGAPPLGTKAQTVLLSKLADEMKDIRRCLDDVSDHPYLKRCDATLNRAPIVGIKGDDIVYINTISTPLEKVISEKWTLFGPKPDGVNLTEGQANHFFPYQGDLCFAVGRSLWRKRHRSEDDPLINKAVNHWPSLYEDSWEKVGDQCLPDTNLLSVISYAALSMDCTKILFHLIILTGDGTIMVSNNDRLVDAASFQKMSNTRNETVTWKKIAYWNDKVVGLDSNNCTWNLTMNFVEHTYKAEEKLQVRAFSEFTATDMGLVGLGENGTLYRRIVNRELRNQDTNKGILKWESWMPQFGVTSIGVASPGARLDLRGLARILKSRYVESATALYLFFDRLKTFGITHSVYLESHLLRRDQGVPGSLLG
ncbi:uncharacterized protein N7483_005497 [Penicillium malachiteum]|uniref:uncharacterized protein n=1 Tax=Penicillium malachiteum TaxID=1324776 RepID=UPI002547DA4D|nr:uncharacterized protein N7483_005497 [Penicillium malachiteum]KAJ5730989.1 hypothetical protein N7483_005497 [Penicillium malachiteum]